MSARYRSAAVIPAFAARPPQVPAAATAIAAVLVLWGNLPFIGIAVGHSTVPYDVPASEYVPVLLSIVCANFLAPRFRLWETLGTSRVQWQALGCAISVIVVPGIVSAIGLLRYPKDANPPLETVIHIVPNVVALSAILYLAVAYLGRGWGTLVFLGLYSGMLVLAAERPDLAAWGPRTMVFLDGVLTAQVKWWWILSLVGAACSTAYWRRGLPLT